MTRRPGSPSPSRRGPTGSTSSSAKAKTAPRRGPQLLREIGPHPDGGVVGLYRGRYGPYVSHDKIYASLPKGADPDTYSLGDAIPLLAAQKAKGKGKSKTRRPQRKAA